MLKTSLQLVIPVSAAGRSGILTGQCPVSLQHRHIQPVTFTHAAIGQAAAVFRQIGQNLLRTHFSDRLTSGLNAGDVSLPAGGQQDRNPQRLQD